MKKYLLIFLSLAISATIFAANLNPYAYNLKQVSYDAENYVLTISYSLNAPANSVNVVAVDAQQNTYLLCECGARNAGDNIQETIQLLNANDIDRLPRNEQLSWRLDVKGEKYTTHQACGRKIDGYTPFSISIDRNTDSPYFGRIVTTQSNNNASVATKVGVYAYNARFEGGYRCIDNTTVALNSNNWYSKTNLTPFRVRVIQDGSGRMLVSSASSGQAVYLWALKDPNNLNAWTPMIYSHTMKDYAPVGLYSKENDSMGSIDFDTRVVGDDLQVLLFGASITSSCAETVTGDALHSGIFTCRLSDLEGGSYRALTEDNRLGGNPHPQVTRSNYQSFLNAHAMFDAFGGVWFCGYGVASAQFPESPALVHFIDGNAALALQYGDGDYLLRKSVGSSSICYNKTFDRFAVSQGNLANEARIYNITQNNGAHPSISGGSSVDVLSYSAKPRYVVDMCWDYADNLYLCLRNQEDAVQGVWVVATALNGRATSTPMPTNKNYGFTMTCDGTQHQVNATANNAAYGKVLLTDTKVQYTNRTYAECTKLTLTARPAAGYKFKEWKDNQGNHVSSDSIYSFYVSKATNLVAHFEYAVYNVEWYNLFEEGKDITTIGVDANDNNLNNRLWYLFMPMFNEFAPATSRGDNGKAGTYNEFNVMGFTSISNNDTKVKNFMTSENSPFYWLGKYILHVTGKTTLTNTQWRKELYAFFNRTNVARNSQGTAYADYTTGNYKTVGHPNYWRKYWTRYGCNLPMEVSYNQALPTTWKRFTKPSSYVTYEPTWYKWNTVGKAPYNGNSHTHILAWRKGSATGPIVTQVSGSANETIKLYASYVKKHLQDDDPAVDPNNVCDATNSEVLRLMYNKTWSQPWHKLTITRKLQGGMFNTICLPINIDLTVSLSADHPYREAEFWEYDGTTSSAYNESGEPVTILNFTKVTNNTIVAGKPYLVYVNNDITEELLFGGTQSDDKISVLCDSTLRPVMADPAATVKINFIGTINPTTIPDGSLILVANNRLAVSTGGKMNGMRGYFQIDDTDPLAAAELAAQAADGRVYISMRKPVTTSVPLAPEAEQPRKPKVQKIMRNGQIYIIRDGVTYTITGARVK